MIQVDMFPNTSNEKCRGFVSENGRLERHQYCPLEPRRVRGTTDKRKTLSIPAKGKPESKRYNEKALKIRLQITRCIGIGAKH